LGAFFILPREGGLLSSDFKMQVECIFHRHLVEGCILLISKSRWGAFFILPLGGLLFSDSKWRWGAFFILPLEVEDGCFLLISKWRWSAIFTLQSKYVVHFHPST
jgi:hypothetical protein